MMRNNTASSMQKTYDECYLKCSTAVYFEDQNNEAEALRSWRSALDQIYYHNAYRVPPHYRPKTETERALQESLRDMEMQCKERVDLLDALRESRSDSLKSPGEASAGVTLGLRTASSKTIPRQSMEQDRGWIGQGTVPAVSYPELSRPAPPLPQRPGMTAKKGSVSDSAQGPGVAQSSGAAPRVESFAHTLPVPPKHTSRSPSPEKKGMRTTLRAGKDGNRASRSPRPSGQRKESGVAASKAATQAWGTLPRQGKDGVGRSLGDVASTTTVNSMHRDGYGGSPIDRTESATSLYRKPQVAENNPFVNPPSPTDYLPIKATISNGARPNDYPLVRPASQQEDDSRRPSIQSQTMEDLVSLEPTAAIPRRSAEDQAPSRRRPKSPPRPSTGAYEWPNFQSRESSTTEKKAHPAPPRTQRLTKPQHNTSLPTSSLPTRQKSPPRKGRMVEKPSGPVSRKPVANSSTPRSQRRDPPPPPYSEGSGSGDDDTTSSGRDGESKKRRSSQQKEGPLLADSPSTPSSVCSDPPMSPESKGWKNRVDYTMKHLPKAVDEMAAKQIFNEIVIKGDEVHWDDVAGLDVAKNALKEAVVYPFLRPDLFMGLREPARGMLLFGPPGTGKTMLARAVATESRSTFFSISASSLTSKYLGESEKLVRALFALAKVLAPSIIFVDEIDSLLSSRSGTEHEATRRIKTEFLIQWSDLARAAAGREQSEKEKEKGDPSRVLVLAATNLPWAIDEAARRRFVRRQYIPLPEGEVRGTQLRTLLGHQKHSLSERDIKRLIDLTDGFSGSDITALAKDAAMGPLRSLGEALLHMSMDEIRPIQFRDFEASLVNIRPSVSKQGLQEFEDWARDFGERGG